MLQFYQYPPCSTCKRAKSELEQLGLDFDDINIKENPPQVDVLKKWLEQSHFELKQFFNTSGQVYRDLGLKDKLATMSEKEALELLASNGMLIKRPLLVKDGELLQIGHRTSYKEL
ncbi:arsenate reductase family protein [Streptococcus sciuri]|uniref:Arsenate reductase family protein n=1 Tax=Streptococcus sciuri TaxID=2973939 RepID=A0ABT2F8I5_9STRE|nr:arsenate reductase family protein [Streptococcus sciuri]MCS4488729.1 arsenate reductase family protein [Streptococcus sciuri]